MSFIEGTGTRHFVVAESETGRERRLGANLFLLGTHHCTIAGNLCVAWFITDLCVWFRCQIVALLSSQDNLIQSPL